MRTFKEIVDKAFEDYAFGYIWNLNPKQIQILKNAFLEINIEWLTGKRFGETKEEYLEGCKATIEELLEDLQSLRSEKK